MNDPIEITWDELESDEVASQVRQLQAAQAAPLVRSVGMPVEESPRAWWRGAVATLTLGGVVGGVVAWPLVEVIGQADADDPWYGGSVMTGNLLFTLLIAVGVGLTLAAWDGVAARSWAKARTGLLRAVPVLLGGGLVGGFVAHHVYSSMIESVGDDAMTRALASGTDLTTAMEVYQDYLASHIHFPRAVAFALVGITVGGALGASTAAVRRAVNGAVGGFVGGFVGGYLFDYIGEASGSGVVSRLVALVMTGAVIGLAMALVEAARREHWLEIVSGGMAGKQFILYHDETLVGAAADCHITLIKDPGIAAGALVLRRTPMGLEARGLDPARPVLVNGAPLAQRVLNDGDTLQLGSTLVRYRDKQQQAPAPGPILG